MQLHVKSHTWCSEVMDSCGINESCGNVLIFSNGTVGIHFTDFWDIRIRRNSTTKYYACKQTVSDDEKGN